MLAICQVFFFFMIGSLTCRFNELRFSFFPTLRIIIAEMMNYTLSLKDLTLSVTYHNLKRLLLREKFKVSPSSEAR